MAKLMTPPQTLKVWFITGVCIALFMIGDHFSQRLIDAPSAATSARWLGVIIGTACLLPVLFVIVGSISGGDEYIRQIALRGTAVGFVLLVLTNVAFAHLQEARLVSWSSHLLPLPAAMGSWVFGMIVSVIYQRLRP